MSSWNGVEYVTATPAQFVAVCMFVFAAGAAVLLVQRLVAQRVGFVASVVAAAIIAGGIYVAGNM
jgi:hypothetical protein